MTEQLQLLPRQPLTYEEIDIDLDQLVGYASSRPPTALIDAVVLAGRLVQRAVVSPTRDGRYEVIEGRRRTNAAAIATTQGRLPQGPVQCITVGGTDTSRREVLAFIGLQMHGTRSESPTSELHLIEEILDAAGGDSESAILAEIAARTGIDRAKLQKRLRLRSLAPELRAHFDAGRIAPSVAEAALRLTHDRQREIAEKVSAGERVTVKSVRELIRERTRAAAQALPDAVFEGRQLTWQALVSGHLRACLAAIPTTPEHAGRIADIERLLAGL